METIVTKRQAVSAPIPVIGIEPALDLDNSKIEGDDKLSCIALLAYYKAEARGCEPGMRCKTGWMPKLKSRKKLKRRKLNECSI